MVYNSILMETIGISVMGSSVLLLFFSRACWPALCLCYQSLVWFNVMDT